MTSPPAPPLPIDALPCGFVQLDAADRVVHWNRRLERWTGLRLAEVAGRRLPEIFPENPAIAPILAEVRANRRPRVLAQMFHRRLIPVPLPPGHLSGLAEMQQECHVVPLEDPAGHVAITVLDVTPLVVGQQRSQVLLAERNRAEEAVRRRAEFLAALNQITLQLMAQRNVGDVLRALAERCSALLGSPHTAIALLEGDDALVVRAFSAGCEYLAGDRVPRGEAGLAWQAVASRQPVVVENYSAHPARRALHQPHGLQATADIPIVHDTACLGVLSLARTQPDQPYAEEEIQHAVLLARMAALALHNAAVHETAVREAEARTAALRESEERFRAVFDQSPIMVALLAPPDARIVELNAAALNSFGYSREEAVGRTPAELGLWCDEKRRDEYFARLTAEGVVAGFEAEMRRKDGSTLTVLHSGCIVAIAGRPYLIASLQDITERKQSEVARERSVALIRATLESTADGILVVNAAGHIATYNGVFADMWCLPRQADGQPVPEAEILPVILRQLVVPETFLVSLRDLYAGSDDEVFDVLQCHDGRVIERYSHPQLIEGRPAGRVWSFRDCTERVRGEEERRTAEEEVRHMQKLESIGTLAGGIAHDFNNILTGIFGFLDLARLELPKEHPTQAWLDRIGASSQRARELVRQILTFSRKQEGKRTLQHLHGAVNETLGLLRSTLPPNVTLESRISADVPATLADATQIHQVVVNLCTNAWQAMPPRGGKIIVALESATVTDAMAAAHPELQPGPHARLTVTDDGSGMDAETLEHIFEPFFTRKEVGTGTGLGLAVVHGIVKLHQGAILVHSTPGAGSTFEVYLPAVVGEAVPVKPKPKDVPCGNGQRILVVDDDPISGFALEMMIQTLNYQVQRCTRPEDALAAFTATPDAWDLVVSDLAMPGMNGDELIARILQLRPEQPAIIVTGYVETARQQIIERASVRAVLHKPIVRFELAQALAAHVRRA